MSEELNDSKIHLLDGLSQAIEDCKGDYEENLEIASMHQILYAGNPEASIMVVQMHPNKEENFWAKHEDTHEKHILINSEAQKFRNAVKRSGYDLEKDFCFVNIIPFYPRAGQEYSPNTIMQLSWIFGGLFDIINPKIVVTLGYDALNTVVDGSISVPQYLHLIKKNNDIHADDSIDNTWGILEYENAYVVPMEHPDRLWQYSQNHKMISYETRMSTLKSLNSYLLKKPAGENAND
jgi:uracil-DNA glycosylase